MSQRCAEQTQWGGCRALESVGPSSLSRCMSAVQVPVSLFMDRLVGVSGPRSPPMPGDIAVSWHSAPKQADANSACAW